MRKLVAYILVAAAVISIAFSAINAAETLKEETNNRKTVLAQASQF